ncbi:MAG: 7TM diverse intracellular signaling domain-containing protein [Cyclobacteriaceae bacterium]
MNTKIFFVVNGLRLLTLISSFMLLPLQVMSQSISGSSTLDLDDNWEERIFSISQLEFFEDSSNLLTIEDIMDPDFQQHIKIRPSFSKNDFNTDYSYWVKLSIRNLPESEKLWLIEFYDQSIDRIMAFIPEKNKKHNSIQLGDTQAFEQRVFHHKNFQIKIKNDTEGISNFYFKINSSQKADIRIAIRSYGRFIYYALNEYLLYGLFYGMILIIAFYNLLIFLAVKEMKYIYYILYLLSVGLYVMSLDGIGFQYIWPGRPEWNYVANGIFSFSIVLWAILFSIRFLNTKRRALFFHYLLWMSLAIKSLFFLMGLGLDSKYFEISYFDLIPFLLIFSTAIYLLSKKYQVARFFVMAYGVLFVGLFIKVLANYAIIEHTTFIYYSLHIAFLIEMVLLSFALGDRIRIMKEIRDKALKRSLLQFRENMALKEKVNLELEFKVKVRTLELESKNHLLQEYNSQLEEKDNEIKRINMLLDRDNWKLKSLIKASFHARLVNELLSYEEFRKIFPDQAACCRYLEEIKWGTGYECRQCGNKKYSNGPKIFTRRCTKCGHIDSVTAGTIFHGIKFPLEKGFYLAYTVVYQTQKKTLNQLAETMKLRKNTIWAFQKKVKEKLSDIDRANWLDIVEEREKSH